MGQEGKGPRNLLVFHNTKMKSIKIKLQVHVQVHVQVHCTCISICVLVCMQKNNIMKALKCWTLADYIHTEISHFVLIHAGTIWFIFVSTTLVVKPLPFIITFSIFTRTMT